MRNFKFSLLTVLLGVVALSWMSTSAFAQTDPTRIGAGQLPYIMIVLDTSGSTEWTDAGDERYPFDLSAAGDGGQNEWVPGSDMGIDKADELSGPTRFGPCMVWEAPWGGAADKCDDYVRPTWNVHPDVPTNWKYPTTGTIGDRFRRMRGTLPTNATRFDPLSQPRHVMLKEVLTGDMVMRSSDMDGDPSPVWNINTHGPGCWFVPRQRYATVQSTEEQEYCLNANEFNDLPDYDEPRPHFQEVFQTQVPNGVLDRLAGQAIFAVAQLDGYKDDVSGWDDGLNDDIKGSVPSPMGVRTDSPNEGDYNLGVYRVIGPKKMEIPSSYLSQLSSFTQIALVDSGWIQDQKGGDFEIDIKKNKPSGLGVTFDKQFEKYVDNHYKLGKQPVARATPLAAAVMDMHQHMLESDVVQDDPFAECRPKQLVLVTDGYPEPELPGGAGGGIGTEALSPAFGYTDLSKYQYDYTESEINGLVTDGGLQAGDRRYGPRVHVVGLSVGGNPAQMAQVVDKLSAMAVEGHTCAGAFIASDYRQEGPFNCDPNVRTCLADGQNTFMYTHPDEGFNGNNPWNCRYPALILTDNDRVSMEEALFQVLSGIISGSGVASRTRVVVSNRLDNDALTEGGQYRVFSGVRIDGSPFWRGILNRQLVPCSATNAGAYDANGSTAAGLDTGGVLLRALHEDVAAQVECNITAGECLNPTDNRRIFTSFPSGAIYDYGADVPKTTFLGLAGHPLFHFVYNAVTLPASSDAVNDDTTIPYANNAALLAGTRIPMHTTELKAAVVQAAGEAGVPAWTTDDTSLFYALPGDGITLDSDLDQIVNSYRGRIASKSGYGLDEARVFAGLVNSNPLVVGPPDLDIPVESYRTFRARYGDRPTIMISSTLDGYIHALHLGDLEGRVAVREQSDDNGWTVDTDVSTKGANEQREAWAYMPNFLIRRLSANVISQPFFMDGNPTVKDVKLCQREASANQNKQACRVADTGGSLTDDQIWRTVLVTGMGSAGDGYVAMDITRTGGLSADAAARTVERPDPALLWEFDRRWERAQVAYLTGNGLENRVRPAPGRLNDYEDNGTCGGDANFWAEPMLGQSVSDPEVGTVLLKYGAITQQRPIAVFGAGFDLAGVPGCSQEGTGSAIYVVDLQTGSILRRFTEYEDSSNNWHTFAYADDFGRFGRSKFTGSPILYDNFTGSVATRGFIGDNRGRLFRMDFTNPDPDTWSVSLFFDPYADSGPAGMQAAADSVLSGSDNNFGPAAYKPAVSLAPDKSLIVTYGLGESGDVTTGGQAQAVVALSEDIANREGNVIWYQVMEEGEKLTGEPIIFNSAVYFPTYAVPSADICLPGFARIWGLDYDDNSGGADSPTGIFDPASAQFGGADIDVDAAGRWFGPTTETLIRGLTITLGPQCSVKNVGAGLDSDGLEGTDAQPQLLAQTGGVPAGAMENKFGGDAPMSKDTIGRLVADLPKPRSMTVPLSWSVVSN